MNKQENGVVNFIDTENFKKKNVRGLLRKRAKKYDSDEEKEAIESDDDPTHIKKVSKKKVQKSTFEKAFESVITKQATP